MKIPLKSFVVLGVFLLMTPHPSEGSFFSFLSLKFNVNFNLRLVFRFKFILNQALNIFQAQNHREMQAIERQMHQDFSIIQQELQDLTKKIDAGFASIDKDIKMSPLIDLIAKQQSQMDRFQIMVNTKSDTANFIYQLDEFIKEYTRENLEDRMVNLLDAGTPGTSSLVEALMRAAKKEAKSESVAMNTSPNRLIYDFYTAVLYHVYRGYYFMESCVFMRDIIQRKLQLEEHEYFRTMTQLSVDKVLKSMKHVAVAFGDDELYQLSYKHLTSEKPYVVSTYYMGLSKAPDGFVITGVRFQLHNKKILYIQIQVGQLIDHGQINATTVHWQEPSEDIEVDVIALPPRSFYFHFGHLSFNDSVLTGIQFKHFSNRLTTVGYGHKFEDHNSGKLGKDVTIKELKLTSPIVLYQFTSANIELGIKAPLNGIAFYHNKQNHIMPQLATYNAKHFIEGIDIDASTSKPMSGFAQAQIRDLIHEKKPVASQAWLYAIIGGSIGFVIMFIAVVVVVVIFRRRETFLRDSMVYQRIHNDDYN